MIIRTKEIVSICNQMKIKKSDKDMQMNNISKVEIKNKFCNQLEVKKTFEDRIALKFKINFKLLNIK